MTVVTASMLVTTSFAQREKDDFKAPAWVESLSREMPKPESVEGILNRVGKPARLINYHLATAFDFSAIGLGKCTYLPVQISNSPYGRKSTWVLRAGEQIVDGIIITAPGKVMTMRTKRISGNGMARTGDKYEISILDEGNRVMAAGKGTFEIISGKQGVSKIRYIMSTPRNNSHGKIIKVTVKYSHWWSMYAGEVTYEYDDGKKD